MKNFTSQERYIKGLKDGVYAERSSLVGEKFNIISMMGEVKYEVEVNKLIGVGGSSLVYEVSVDDTYPPIKKMIMKEFYPNYDPDVITVERSPFNKLELYFDAVDQEHEQRVKKDRDKFIDAYTKHIRILELDPYLEGKIVRPYRVEIDNSYLYSLYEVDSATSVDKYYNLDLARIVDILIQTSEILIHLHNNDIIYMDLKPENILYDYNNSKVKLFDFDAAIDLNELDYVNEFYMPSEKSFIPPELRFITDISKRKELFISEEIDLYMLGVTFFTLLMGRFPVDLENEDMDYLARNIKDTLNKKSHKILVNSKAIDGIVRLLQETLSIHRLISVDDFRDRLKEIQANLRFRDNEDFSNIVSAAFFLDSNRLYNYIIEDEDSKHIDVAIVGNNEISRIFFSFIFSTVNIEDVDLNITFYVKNPKVFYEELIRENPLLRETTKISLKSKLVNNTINPNITDKPYAYLNFQPSSAKIMQPYILILDKTGYDFINMADTLYNEFKNDEQKRVILNYSRNNHEVDVRQEDNISYYNLDLTSTTTFINREFNDKILDEAFLIYKLYVMNHLGERYDNEAAWNNFISDDFYNLKSSLRVALSIEYFKFIAGIEDGEDFADKFYHQLQKAKQNKDEITIRDILADHEHHSWNRFMIVDGFKVPSKEELMSYAYIDNKGYIDYQQKFHPLITNSNIRKVKNGELDKLAEVSHYLDTIVREKTVYKEEQVKSRILNILNNTLWDDNQYLKELRPLWVELVKLSYSIMENEFYAKNSLNVLTFEIENVLNKANPDLSILSTDYYQIKEDLDIIIKRNKKLDIRFIDYMIIDSIPLISSDRIRTIYKPFIDDDEDLWANIIATIKFNPERLVFITDHQIDENKIYRITDFLHNKRLQKSMEVEIISYDDFKYYSQENAVVDLTLNSHSEGKRDEYTNMEFVEYTGSNQWCGDYKALDFYQNSSSLSVEETFFLNNGRIHDNGSLSHITRLINYYKYLWDAYVDSSSDDWVNFVKAIKYSEKYYILCLEDYQREEDHSLIEVGDFKFRRYDTVKYKSLKHLLDELVKEDILIEYEFPLNPGKLKLHSYNDELSRQIGDFISVNMWEYNEGFELVKKQEAENNYEYSYCIFSDKLSFEYEYPVNNPKSFAKITNNIMVEIDSTNDGQMTRVFNHIDDKPYIKVNDKSVSLSFEYGDVAFREFFNKFNNKGSILRVYSYFELVQAEDFFDEVKLRVNLRWKAYDDYSEDTLPIENYLDVVCTKGFTTIIISAVEGHIQNEDLYEINNHSKQFGMDTKPVLIATNTDDDTSQIKMIAAAAGVYFIDREMIVNNGIAQYVKNITEGKKNWQEV